MTTADDIVTYARSWTGAKWRHQGRGDGPDRGIDCIGLLVVTARHFNLPHADVTGYRRDPGAEFVGMIEAHSERHFAPIHGAIGIFSDTVMPCHTGIFAVSPKGVITVIHSEVRPAGRVHEQAFKGGRLSLEARLVDIRLFKDVDYVR